MSSTGHDFPGGAEKKEKEEKQDEFADEASLPPSKYDNTHRKLKSRHIQVLSTGGASRRRRSGEEEEEGEGEVG